MKIVKNILIYGGIALVGFVIGWAACAKKKESDTKAEADKSSERLMNNSTVKDSPKV